MSIPPPSGGGPARPGSRSPSATPGWSRWACPRTRFRTREKPFGTGEIHIEVSVFSDTEDKWRRTMQTARQQYQGFAGITVLMAQDFGAQPGDRNPLGYKDSIGQPAIEGSSIEPLPGQGPRDRATPGRGAGAMVSDCEQH